MVGLGESSEEVHQLLRDLRQSNVDVATLGQYLQPARRNLPVAEYVTLPGLTPIAITASPSALKWSSADRSSAARTWRRSKRRSLASVNYAFSILSAVLLILIFPATT